MRRAAKIWRAKLSFDCLELFPCSLNKGTFQDVKTPWWAGSSWRRCRWSSGRLPSHWGWTECLEFDQLRRKMEGNSESDRGETSGEPFVDFCISNETIWDVSPIDKRRMACCSVAAAGACPCCTAWRSWVAKVTGSTDSPPRTNRPQRSSPSLQPDSCSCKPPRPAPSPGDQQQNINSASPTRENKNKCWNWEVLDYI